MGSIWVELRRRNVVKVGAAYLVVAWLILQVAATAFPALHLPDWTVTFVIVLLAIGFPLALILAWAYELTPEGIKRTHEVPPEISRSKLSGRKLDFLIIGLLGAAVVALVLDKTVFHVVPTAVPEPVDASAVTAIRSIAVLPFVNMSSDPDQEFFADGLTEEILNSLTRIPDLQVTARTSAFAFKGKAEDLKAVGRTLGVAHVLEGSVRRSGDRLRITTQLINTESGFHLWSEVYDRPLSDIFAIQDDIARAVASAMQVTLGIGVGQQPGMTRNVEAYDAWLAAGGVTYTGLQSMREHIDLLQQAVALDPEFANPWWDLSEAYSSTLSGRPADAAERKQKADAAFAEYRRLLPDSPRIHERLAEDAIEAGQMLTAAEHYEAAAAAASRLYGGKPPPLEIFGQGKTAIGFPDLVGRPRESIALFEQERARDPLNEVVALWLAYLYSVVGDFSGAFSELERAERLGNDARLTYLAVPVALASGNRERLLHWLDKRIEYERSLGIVFSEQLKPLLDRPQEALAVLRPLVRDGHTAYGTTAWWLAWFGNPESALDALRVDFHQPGSRYAILWILWDSGFAEVRKLPGFKQLMNEAGLVDYWRHYGWGDYCKPVAGDDFECR